MTREEVKKAADIMLAFADGVEIQYSHKGQNNWLNWINESSPSFDWQTFDYRIKKEPKYRPFQSREECWSEMHKHPDFGWIIYNKTYYSICDVTSNEITILYECDPCCIDFKSGLEEATFADGTPFGIKEN